MDVKLVVLVVLSVFASTALSLHLISRRISDLSNNSTQELNATEANDNSTVGNTFTPSASNLTDNQTSNSSVGNQTESSLAHKSIAINETNETTVNTTTVNDDSRSSVTTSASNQTTNELSTELSSNWTQNSTEPQVIDFTADDNTTKSHNFYQWVRYKTIKLKIIAFEDQLKTLMNQNMFYSLAIPAAIGVSFALCLLILVFCCKNFGHITGRCCYRVCCFCCLIKNRRTNRLKYSKSKHLFGDEKNYLLVSNNDSDVEIET